MAEANAIGLIVNPIAGIGGPLAARGSDRLVGCTEAGIRGSVPMAEERARRALRRLKQRAGDIGIIAAAGRMGADAAVDCGFVPLVPEPSRATITGREDTMRAAGAMIDRGVGLILFAGGDGTARDIFDVAGDRLPLVGIPTGVKMHSAVFALSPEAAGETVALAMTRSLGIRPAEIMDADEAELAAGRPSARLFGYAVTPALPRLFQAAKAARPDGGEAAIAALGHRLAREARSRQLLVLGPGTTMSIIKRAFGFEGTLLGADVIRGGEMIAVEADARTLERLCRDHADIGVIVGVVGGQGFVFGRGNQQISAAVLRHVKPTDLKVVATREKLLALASGELRVDTGDMDLDYMLDGYFPIETGPNDRMMMRLRAGF